MIQEVNKNVAVWRGDKTPPTVYHIWIKSDGNIYIHNGLTWEINNTSIITDLDYRLSNEILEESERALEEEAIIKLLLLNEVDRATEKELQLKTNLNLEIERATLKEAVLLLEIEANTKLINEETKTRIEEVSKLTEYANTSLLDITTLINNEVTRATTKENSLETAINSEESRATTAENKLQENIKAEEERAIAADEALQKLISEEIITAINKEVLDRTNSDNAIITELTNTASTLNEKIEEVANNAKSYSLVALTENLPTNVKEAWKLIDEDGTLVGSTISIYKDSSLKGVSLVDLTLNFVYILADGNESTIGIDISKFLAESEFKNGLQVLDSIVSVKIDKNSETFLTVSESGISLNGVLDAINIAKEDAITEANNYVEDILLWYEG